MGEHVFIMQDVHFSITLLFWKTNQLKTRSEKKKSSSPTIQNEEVDSNFVTTQRCGRYLWSLPQRQHKRESCDILSEK